jgi:hypothetical protein
MSPSGTADGGIAESDSVARRNVTCPGLQPLGLSLARRPRWHLRDVGRSAGSRRTPSVWPGDLGWLDRASRGKRRPSTLLVRCKPLRNPSPCGEPGEVGAPTSLPKSPLHSKGASCVRRAGARMPTVPRQALACQTRTARAGVRLMALLPRLKRVGFRTSRHAILKEVGAGQACYGAGRAGWGRTARSGGVRRCRSGKE